MGGGSPSKEPPSEAEATATPGDGEAEVAAAALALIRPPLARDTVEAELLEACVAIKTRVGNLRKTRGWAAGRPVAHWGGVKGGGIQSFGIGVSRLARASSKRQA